MNTASSNSITFYKGVIVSFQNSVLDAMLGNVAAGSVLLSKKAGYQKEIRKVRL